MAQIWFGDLEALVTKFEIDDFEKAEKDLNLLYERWEVINPAVTKNLKPIKINKKDRDVIFTEEFIGNFGKDKFIMSFVCQGGNFSSREISWGPELESELDNKDILFFTNQLLLLLGKNSEFSFIWTCMMDDGYENYTVESKPGEKVPNSKHYSDFYEGDGDDVW